MANENKKPSGIAWTALILVILLIIALIIIFIFVFVRRDIPITGVALTQISGTTTGLTDSFDISKEDIYISKNSATLALTLNLGEGIKKDDVKYVKNNGAKTTDIITVTQGAGLTIVEGQLGKTIKQGITAQYLATTDTSLLRLQ